MPWGYIAAILGREEADRIVDAAEAAADAAVGDRDPLFDTPAMLVWGEAYQKEMIRLLSERIPDWRTNPECQYLQLYLDICHHCGEYVIYDEREANRLWAMEAGVELDSYSIHRHCLRPSDILWATKDTGEGDDAGTE